jgi:hypothetical protein
VVVLDPRLPELPDGIALIRRIRAIHPGVRILAVGWTPTLEETLTLPAGGSHRIYLWVVRDGGVVGGAR